MPIPEQIRRRVADVQARIQQFQDRWDRPHIEQFVAADYEHVFQALSWTLETQPMIGRRFLEWGCGFAAVSALADYLGFDALGIEAVDALVTEGRRTIEQWSASAELVHGNFLPSGAETLTSDPTLPSLGHQADDGYDQLSLTLDDFAIVYAYPWPGEDDFHESVFDHYAANGALLMLFCGPNDIRLWRKVRGREP